MRDDLAEDSLDSEDVLKNAPRREGEFFRVNAVLEE
jgi:Asp-tRNA(Asn)/Glu-tRNA(Gln) amidotransferase C subunit